MAYATETAKNNEMRNKLRKENVLMTQTISQSIEKNLLDFLESEIALSDTVKRDGKMCL